MYGCFVSIGSPGDRHKPKVIEKRRPKAESIVWHGHRLKRTPAKVCKLALRRKPKKVTICLQLRKESIQSRRFDIICHP